MYDSQYRILFLFIFKAGVFLEEGAVHTQGVLVGFLHLIGSETTLLVEAYGTVFFGCKCFNGQELTAGKSLVASLNGNLFNDEIANSYSSPFLLYGKVSNVKSRIAGFRNALLSISFFRISCPVPSICGVLPFLFHSGFPS